MLFKHFLYISNTIRFHLFTHNSPTLLIVLLSLSVRFRFFHFISESSDWKHWTIATLQFYHCYLKCTLWKSGTILRIWMILSYYNLRILLLLNVHIRYFERYQFRFLVWSWSIFSFLWLLNWKISSCRNSSSWSIWYISCNHRVI